MSPYAFVRYLIYHSLCVSLGPICGRVGFSNGRVALVVCFDGGGWNYVLLEAEEPITVAAQFKA
jgi:hypothetical protein